MFAIEFQVKVKNGVIEIPAEFREQLQRESGNDEVRVIVLTTEQSERESSGNDLIGRLLLAPQPVAPLNPLSRYEAHERR